jgi:hypothetical protein
MWQNKGLIYGSFSGAHTKTHTKKKSGLNKNMLALDTKKPGAMPGFQF